MSGLFVRLVALSALTGVIVGTAGVGLLHVSAQRVLRRQSLNHEEQIAQRLAALLDNEASSAVDSLRVMAANPSLISFGPDVTTELNVDLRVSPRFDMLELVDVSGRPRAVAATRSLIDLASLPLRADLLTSTGASGFAIRTVPSSRPEAEIAVAIEQPSGVVGTLVGTVNLEDLAEPIEALHLEAKGVAFLTDRSGVVIAHPDLSQVVGHVTFPVGKFVSSDRASGAGRVREHLEQLAAVASAQVYPGDVVVEVPERSALALTSRSVRQFSLIVVLVVLATVTGFVLASRALLRRLSPLAEAVRRFGTGDFTSRAADAPAELGLLASEFNHMADRLAEAFERERVIVETAHDAIFEVGADGRIGRLNPAFAQLFGWDCEDWVGRMFADLLHPEDLGEVAQLVRGNPSPGREIRMLTRGGDYRTVEVTSVPRRQGERVLGVLGIARDITERKNAEEALRRSEKAYADAFARERDASDRLRDLDRLKDEFLATVSHELRTPLTVILGASELLAGRDHNDPSVRQELFTSVHRNAVEMQKLIDQLLDFSLLEAGKVSVDRHRICLHHAVASALEKLGPLLGEHDVLVTVPDDIDVVADANAVDRILGNLVGNAAKYSPRGTRVSVSAERNHGFARIDVSDEGAGIPEADRTRVFERFYRGAGGKTGRRGAGIGLSIVRRYVHLLGGSVWVESEEGRGSTFSFTLPVDGADLR